MVGWRRVGWCGRDCSGGGEMGRAWCGVVGMICWVVMGFCVIYVGGSICFVLSCLGIESSRGESRQGKVNYSHVSSRFSVC